MPTTTKQASFLGSHGIPIKLNIFMGGCNIHGLVQIREDFGTKQLLIKICQRVFFSHVLVIMFYVEAFYGLSGLFLFVSTKGGEWWPTFYNHTKSPSMLF